MLMNRFWSILLLSKKIVALRLSNVGALGGLFSGGESINGLSSLGSLTSDPSLANALNSVSGAQLSMPSITQGKAKPEPIIPKLKDFDLTPDDLARTDPEAVLKRLNAETTSEPTEPLPAPDQEEAKMKEILSALTKTFQQSQVALSVASIDAQSAMKKITQLKAQMDAENAKKGKEPQGIEIKLYDESGEAVVASNEVPEDKSSAQQFKLSSEQMVVPLVYTQPDTMEEVSYITRYCADLILQSYQAKITKINMMFRQNASLDRIRDQIGFLKSYIRSQKEYTETAMSSLTKTLVMGSAAV